MNKLEKHANAYDSVDDFVKSYKRCCLYHGSATGQFGNAEVHVGTERAAQQALEARIGIRADGKMWDGTKEYGETLLAGTKTLHQLDPRGYNKTGFNCSVLESDFYLKDHPELAKANFSDGTRIPLSAKPNLFLVRIIGKMTNSLYNPMSDAKANGIMRGMIKRMCARRGYYYKNIAEDEGSISAVVPSKSHLEICLTEVQLIQIWNKVHKAT